MKVFRHTNRSLYTIQQIGRGTTITPPKDWKHYKAIPYKTNPNAPTLELLTDVPDLQDFKLEFEE